MSRPDHARRWAALLLVIYVALIGVVWIIPRPIDQGVTPWLRGVLDFMHRRGFPGVVDYDFVEDAAHLVLFVPFGMLLAVALGRRLVWLAVLAGLGVSALVEFWSARAAAEPASWLDLLLNAVGAVVGTAIGYAVLIGLRRGPLEVHPTSTRTGR